MLFALKLILSAVIIAGASELGKRSTLVGALLISLPLSSMLALTWLYAETKDTVRVAAMSSGIFWGVFPSLLFLFVLPTLLKRLKFLEKQLNIPLDQRIPDTEP